LQQQALRSLDLLPPFSPILNRLLATLADADVSVAQLASLIEKDTVVAGHVLRVVNAAAYACRGRVTSVAHAISLMGTTKLRNTALACSVIRLWRGVPSGPNWSLADFNLHCIATATFSDRLAGRVDVHYPEGAFVAGLFHDLGKLMIAFGLPTHSAAIYAGDDRVGDEVLEREFLGFTHARLSALALDRWKFPRPVENGVAFHHDPQSAPPDSRGGSQFSLADIVCCADALVRGNPEALGKLGLEAKAEMLLPDLDREYESLKSLL
jgi:HD-like signal output (HDOD) protein